MGEFASEEAGRRFAEEFERDAIEKYGIHVPGLVVKQYFGVDDSTFEVHLYLTIRVPATTGEALRTLRVEDAPSFFSIGMDDDDLSQSVMHGFGLEEEEARRRLRRVGLLSSAP